MKRRRIQYGRQTYLELLRSEILAQEALRIYNRRIMEGRIPAWGRGVIAVTNLNDSGPGSFRAAVESLGPRHVEELETLSADIARGMGLDAG